MKAGKGVRMGRGKGKAVILLALFVICLSAGAVSVSAAQTIESSPYVSFSPDRQAWTTNEGDRNIRWYRKGEAVETGIRSTLRKPEEGEHYYYRQAQGIAAVGRWVVEHGAGQCIHTEYQMDYHGISYAKSMCRARHYSGWIAYCADCGERISDLLVYMSREAAETIDYIPLGMDYYYLCPFCRNLEQGRTFEHMCKAVSANMYRVVYDANFPSDAGTPGGYMAYSLHMYRDAEEYEGAVVTPARELTQNAYECTGYRFAGWNRRPDGSGDAYEDGARIRNLTTENWNGMSGRDETGTVILYAQWEPVEGVLLIDPAGGAYDGRRDMTEIRLRYGGTYVPDLARLEPSAGYQVSFQVNGGVAIQPVTAPRYFCEWSRAEPFSGVFQDGIYRYTAPEGSRDTLRAVYGESSIILPQAWREGCSFGGWYFDEEFRIPAGGGGDTITPSHDLLLYAKWVDLKLDAADNYSAYGGSGAVNLSWRMEDGKDKTYLLYQSLDGENWVKIGAADDVCKKTDMRLEFERTGKAKSCPIPYAGIYTIALSGAQGGGFNSYDGGRGGSVELKVWLEKGEILTINVGGEDGYNGGGDGSVYGNGGGCTVLSSDRKGVIAVAGGGGGASDSGGGGEGGSRASLAGTEYAGEDDMAEGGSQVSLSRTEYAGEDGTAEGGSQMSLAQTEYAGQDGMAGGGGGFPGGTAGGHILHVHRPVCYAEISGAISADPGFYRTASPGYSFIFGHNLNVSGTGAIAGGHSSDNQPVVSLTAGNRDTYLETPYAGTLTFMDAEAGWDVWGEGAYNAQTSVTVFFIHEDGRITSETVVPDRAGAAVTVRNEVWYRSGGYVKERPVYTYTISNRRFSGTIEIRYRDSCEDPIGSFHGIHATYTIRGTYCFEVAEDVRGVYIEARRTASTMGGGCWINAGIQDVVYRYSGRTVRCGYEEGQIEAVLPARGGSSYVNPDVVLDHAMNAGNREGDGCASLASVQAGFQEETELKDIVAKDLAAPRAVSADSVKRTPAGAGLVSISWEEPKDEGTVYYHKAEAYMKGNASLLCTSNITKNTLISGVAGYFYAIDGEEDSAVDAAGDYTAGRRLEIPVAEGARYLHIAAVDAAGNIGETTHVRIDAEDMPWEIVTRQLEIDGGENVYPAGEKTYYVRCDGTAPFLLKHAAYMDGPAAQGSRLVYSIFEADPYGWNIVYTPPGENAEDMLHFTEDAPLLTCYPYYAARRTDGGRSLEVEQMFTLDMEANGKSVEVIPRAGAVFQEAGLQKTYYSRRTEDACNGITLMGDGEGPVISGLDVLSEGQLIDRLKEDILLRITAADDLSGVAEFYVTVTNRNNYSTKTFYGENGVIDLGITGEDALFTGEFTVTAHAEDHVGNVTQESRTVTEFALEAKIHRILAPHDPVFKRGESGILYITVYGYAERVEVEFPPELAEADESLRKIVFDCTDMQIYRQESSVQFMVPLYIPADQSYALRVRAFLKGMSRESAPMLYVTSEGGDVLSEFRTRLR